MKRRTVAITLLTSTAVILAPAAVGLACSVGHSSSVADAPTRDVALVLGAGVRPNGEPSDFLRGRLETARQLYAAGKVRVILVSGDNKSADYDEPTAMKKWLASHGVAEDKIVLDYAGFDTYDSCVRAKKIFGVTQVTLVTQGYHLPRALTICRAVGLDAHGVGDGSMARRYPGGWAHGMLREIPGGWKMAYDLLTQRTPVLGEPESGVTDALARP